MPNPSASSSRGVGSHLSYHAIDTAISNIYENLELDYQHWTKTQFLSIFVATAAVLAVLVLGQAYYFRRLRLKRDRHDHEA